MIALYKRVSTTEQAQNGHSLDEQEERMRNYCKAFKWDNLKVYCDGGYSGSNLQRPAVQRLISDIQAHKIEKVIVYKLDRLSRSQKDTLMLIEDTFLKNGCDFVSISENFDTSTPLGRAMIGILSVFAQLEREQIKERMFMGKEARAKSGKYSSPVVPIGYDYINGELIPNDFEKQQIIYIFEEYAKGKSCLSIVNDLNEKGMTHKYGKWIEATLRTILEQKTYIGYVQYNRKWFKGIHQPLISEELFETVQKIVRRKYEQYMKWNQRAGKSNSYLAGVLYCSHCGAKYSKKTAHTTDNGKKYTNYYYTCNSRTKKNPALVTDPDCKNKHWKMSELDEMVFDEIRKLAFEKPKKEKTKRDNKAIEKKIAEIDKKIERFMELYSLGNLPIDVIKQKIDELNEQKTKLSQIPEEKITPLEAYDIAKSLDDILKNGDIGEINALVKSLIDKIEIDGENISIYWAF